MMVIFGNFFHNVYYTTGNNASHDMDAVILFQSYSGQLMEPNEWGITKNIFFMDSI